MKIPEPRGPLSAGVAAALRDRTPLSEVDHRRASSRVAEPGSILHDEDAQLTLYTLYGLHYHAYEDAPGDREWDPDFLRVRAVLESRMESELREATRDTVEQLDSEGDVGTQLFELVAADDGPSVASYIHRHATRKQVLEFLRVRSVYALKESDSHSFVLPRLTGSVKAALAEIQYDEYGSGRPDHVHSTLYAEALRAAGLDPAYGAYVADADAETLAADNLHSLLGLHRRLRGAAMGLLAAFECSSSIPSRKIAAGIERVGLPAATAAYYHEHVEADAVHEQVAVRDVCAALIAAEPHLREDVMFGAAACLHLDSLAGHSMLARWDALPDQRRTGANERRAS